jgi:hypothetical protein
MRVDGYVRVPEAEYVEMSRHLRHYHREMPGLMAVAIESQRRMDEGHWRAIALEERAREPEPMPTWKLVLYVGGAGVGAFLFGLVIGYAANDGVTLVTP